jgi:hypothetical protein
LFIPTQILYDIDLDGGADVMMFRPWKERENAVDSKLGVAPICMVESELSY